MSTTNTNNNARLQQQQQEQKPAGDGNNSLPAIAAVRVRRVRGIANTTGTACHLNAALIVLGHALGPFSAALAVAAGAGGPGDDREPSPAFVRELGRLVRDLTTTTTTTSSPLGDDLPPDEVLNNREAGLAAVASTTTATTPLDPSAFFATLRKEKTGLEAEDLGDAVTALTKLIQRVVSNSDNATAAMMPLIRQLHDTVLNAGRAHSVLLGERPGSERRTKRLKERRLANPFPLQLPARRGEEESPPTRDGSLSPFRSALQRAFCGEHVVRGYQWPEDEDHDDRVTAAAAANGAATPPCGENGGWTTTKRLHVTAVPPIFMLHLQRFEWNGARQRPEAVVENDKSLEIPATLDLQEYLSPAPILDATSGTAMSVETGCCAGQQFFQLVGGILHVSDPTDDDEDEEDGHYVAVVVSDDSWFLVDDDKTEQVSLNQVLRWLGGDWYDESCNNKEPLIATATTNEMVDEIDCKTRTGAFFRGVLIVYQRSDLSTIADPILKTLFEDLRLNSGGNNPWTSSRSIDNPSNSGLPAARDLVGRRLRVRWSRGKLYDGLVTSYDAATGKHTVMYDDGDVRQYNLSQKTVEYVDDPDSAAGSSSERC